MRGLIALSLFGLMNLIGYALLVGSYIPQYYRLYKVKHSGQINIFWPGITVVALALMEPLALDSGLLEYAVGNTAGLVACLGLCAQVLYYRRNNGNNGIKPSP